MLGGVNAERGSRGRLPFLRAPTPGEGKGGEIMGERERETLLGGRKSRVEVGNMMEEGKDR